MKNDIEIVSDKVEKKQISKKLIAIIVAAVLILSLGAIFATKSIIDNNNGKNDKEYQQTKQYFKNQGFEYSYDEYKQDKKDIENGRKPSSKAAVAVRENNSRELDTLNKSLAEAGAFKVPNKEIKGIDPGKKNTSESQKQQEISTKDISDAIINEMKGYKDFIDNKELGYSDQYKEYPEVHEFNRNFIRAIRTGDWSKIDKDIFYPLTQEKAVDNFGMSVKFKTVWVTNYEYSDGHLKQWSRNGAKIINSINSISIKNNDKYDPQVISVGTSNIIASVNTNAGNFKVGLNIELNDPNKINFTITDIE